MAANAPLQELLRDVAACRICAEQPVGRPLPHDPRPVVRLAGTARLLIAGQAPGTKVHATGLPFNDASGKRLREWMGVDSATFYDQSRIAFLPMGFCFPGQDAAGGDLPPRKECSLHWRQRLVDALPDVRLVLAIGRHAQVWHLGALGLGRLAEGGVDATLRRWREIHAATQGRLIVLPHPSWRNTGWLNRNPWFNDELLPVLRAEVARAISAADGR
jgi:uracil-DNA glycosylase